MTSSVAAGHSGSADGLYRRHPAMHDSGLGSLGSESDTSPNAIQLTATGVTSGMTPVVNINVPEEALEVVLPPPSDTNPTEQFFTAKYCGDYTLDRRYTQSMLPWVMADVRRKKTGQTVNLVIEQTALNLKVIAVESGEVLFEHKLQTMTRFAKTWRDVKCFSYLIRPGVDSAFTCHVYQSAEEIMVDVLFDAIRKASATAARHYSDGLSSSSDDAATSTTQKQFYEVLYVGKVQVSAKKAPPTFIDDAVKKFDEFNRQQQQPSHDEGPYRRHESSTSVQSLPSNLEKTVSIRENELVLQTFKERDSSADGTGSSGSEDAFADPNDVVPLGGSSRRYVPTGSVFLSDSKGSASDSLSDGGGGRERGTRAENAWRNGGDGCGAENLQRLALQLQQRRLSTCERNRTMLIQIGQNELSLISLDRRSTIFERQFKDISFCSQGISNPEHFGFISRNPDSGSLICYVFQCASESVVEEVMLTLKQAFQSAFQQNATRNLVICELCPMHQLHKLCQEIDRMAADEMCVTLQQRLEQLSEEDQNEVMSQVERGNAQSLVETVEIMMAVLLKLSEYKQKHHTHMNDAGYRQNRNEFILIPSARNKPSKFESFRNLAKKSIANSLEHFLGSQGHNQSKDETSNILTKQVTWNDRILNFYVENVYNSGSLINKPIMEELYCRDVDLRRPTQMESSVREIRQRRHSTPHNIHSFIRSSVLENRNSGPGGIGVEKIGRQSTETKKIPSDSPIRSMFVKVGNNVSSQNRRRTGLPSMAPSSAFNSSSTTSLPLQNLENHQRKSWRLSILSRVVSQSDSVDATDGDLESSLPENLKLAAKERTKELWRKAILDTILLIRMDKENKFIEDAQNKVDVRDMKIDYEEMTPCLKEVTKVWEQMLNCDDRSLTKFSLEKLTKAVQDGVPRGRRGEIWELLVEQNRLHHGDTIGDLPLEFRSLSYYDLLKQLTIHQHAILIDLGRTFPGHPYFTVQLGQGQLSLFNLLKAYSLLDLEVGYCQGLSFVAGILLMHLPEEKAFEIMKFMMFVLGFRRQYRPDMVSLQIRMYQLSRLLHDLHKDLYDHFEFYEVAPTLYAAPWFLTIFASQFPLGFVGRVFDLVFLQGTEVVVKVALVLLGNHKELIKHCDSFESVVEFLKTTLPEMGIIQMERIINQVFSMEISKQLEAYEVEYHVLQEEMTSLCSSGGTAVDEVVVDTRDRLARLQVANDGLRRQKMELLEQLQVTRRQIHSLEDQNQTLLSNKQKLESQNRSLEMERSALLSAITKLRQFVPNDVLGSVEFVVLSNSLVDCPRNNNGKAKTAGLVRIDDNEGEVESVDASGDASKKIINRKNPELTGRRNSNEPP